jgi:hypothetical protein
LVTQVLDPSSPVKADVRSGASGDEQRTLDLAEAASRSRRLAGAA